MASDKRRILIQLDSDAQPSVFDAVVAVDAGAEHLLRHGSVTAENVTGLVHGAMFTRGPDDLHRTAIFIGGSDVGLGDELLRLVRKTFFGPLRVSVLMDSAGCNTTAAAAVLAAAGHVNLAECKAVVLAATGPVGQRAVRLLARQGAEVVVGSRQLAKAESVARSVAEAVPAAKLHPHATETEQQLAAALQDAQIVIACGAAGVQLLSAQARQQCAKLQVAVDLNAVPPAGLEGIEPHDRGTERDGVFCYGALGVGGAKMKIHKAAIARLFESNDQVLDAEEIYDLGLQLKK